MSKQENFSDVYAMTHFHCDQATIWRKDKQCFTHEEVNAFWFAWKEHIKDEMGGDCIIYAVGSDKYGKNHRYRTTRKGLWKQKSDIFEFLLKVR